MTHGNSTADRTDPSAPRPIAAPRRKTYALIGVGCCVAAVLLIVIFKIDNTPRRSGGTPTPPNLVELLPPERLNTDDVTNNQAPIGQNLTQLGAENTWIQTTRDGRLAQQYRFASHDPNPEDLPPGWSKVRKPEIQFFMSDDRVLTLESETALLRIKGELLESGHMTGRVVIRMYRHPAGRAFDPGFATPELEVQTPEAVYDNMQGEIRCDGSVDVQTVNAHLPGNKLRVQINEVDSRIEWLRLETVGEIRLASLEQDGDTTSEQTPPAEATTSRTLANHSAEQPLSPRQGADSARPSVAVSYYRLTLNKNIHVQQGDSESGWVADGDDLHVIFALESRTLGPTLSRRDSRKTHAVAPTTTTASDQVRNVPAHPVGVIASLAIGSGPLEENIGLFQPSTNDIIITCGDGLTMTPLSDPAKFPSSTEEARIELVGSPLRMRSHADQANVTGRLLTYHSARERMEVHGSREYPLVFNSPQLQGEGNLFWLVRANHTAGFAGEGWLLLRETADTTRSNGPQPTPSQSTADHVRIQWTDRVELAFDSTANDANRSDSIGSLRKAAFVGNVEVTTDEMFMRADDMTVTLPPRSAQSDMTVASGSPPERDQSIESILANGSVRALMLPDQGSLACNTLHLQFMQSADGRPSPSSMSATGDVAAVDQDRQTVWADRLEIAFLSPEELASAGITATSEPSLSVQHRSARVKSLQATDNVQILLADGARAFADRLEHEAAANSVALIGRDVMIVNGRAVIHRGTRLELNTANQSALWPGGGRFAYFAQDVTASDPVRMNRPVVEHINGHDNPIQVRATWAESMSFDGTLNDGAGSLTLTGKVEAESKPTALEHNTLISRALTMQFIRAEESSNTDAPRADVGADGALNTSKRQLKLFIAEGDAKLESRTWLNEDHSDKPRVFYLAGPTVTYDDQTLEATVPGGGELLVRDERITDPPPADAVHPEAANESMPFSGKGTTLFRWNDHLNMKRQAGALYDIDMVGAVQVRHMAIDKTVSTVTAQQLSATVERAGTAAPAEQGGATLDLGGTMELRRLRGNGGIYLRSPTREVDCEDFEYNYTTGIAEMNALPGRTVMMKTAGNPNPLRAARVVWNILEDKISATNVRGSTPR